MLTSHLHVAWDGWIWPYWLPARGVAVVVVNLARLATALIRVV
jgi:hypothetical protein